MLALNFQTVPHVWITDPDIAQDIFVGKNALLDKDFEQALMFQPLLGNCGAFSRNDESWRIKRKACAHAFYKERMVHLMENLRIQTQKTFSQWNSEVHDKGHHEINMATEFNEIFTRNIVAVLFGDDFSQETWLLKVREGDKYVSKQMSMKDGVFTIASQIGNSFYSSAGNPINWFYPYLEYMFPACSDTKIS